MKDSARAIERMRVGRRPNVARRRASRGRRALSNETKE
ncbi:hypothetical protein C7S16_2928 [Burkholderia thailandensis]|uniref:Uncharacterized protein n=1 Tax=Burkholderia thailandensis TaxID=57975 RepID=A0AAW9CY35_BURTH|nr:hypothetical protein [Burkholderia thailandensis]MDW9254811.1 hypothetical protein [Burkholderia thailandensis]